MPEASDLWHHTSLLSSPPKMSKQGSKKAKIAKMKGDPNNDKLWYVISPTTHAPHTPPCKSSGSRVAPIILSDCDSGRDTENTRQLAGVPSNAPKIGAIYESFEDAKLQISAFEEKKGNKIRVGQSKKRANGEIKKITLCCHAYGTHVEAHRPNIDPQDHCRGKTIKSGCMAHYNLLVLPGMTMWQLSLATYDHNHGCNLVVGASAPQRASKAHKNLVTNFATKPGFSR
ncbi:hypothetical protein K439DRAFT_1621867 [Ramaria rubella]|nr:hypothetical protein K439DRAFT_1621867 [Ramaria rubella]